MILVDTSIWVDHLRVGSDRLKSLLHDDLVLCHPFVIGEVSCGSLRHRTEVIRLLSGLPMCPTLTHETVMEFLLARRFFGRGIGWIDVHLLASAMASGAKLWTNDHRPRTVAQELHVALTTNHD